MVLSAFGVSPNMTPAEFKLARESIGATRREFASMLGLGKNGVRTVERIEAGATITGPMALAVRSITAQPSMD